MGVVLVLMGVLFGLAMDSEVFLVSRMREEFVHTRDAVRSITVGFTSSARVVTAAAIIMISVFAAFVPHSDMAVKPIALGLAVGVFVDAFLVRMTLVPAVLALLGGHAGRRLLRPDAGHGRDRIRELLRRHPPHGRARDHHRPTGGQGRAGGHREHADRLDGEAGDVLGAAASAGADHLGADRRLSGFGFPVVPQGQARLRCQISAAHEQDHLDRAVAAVKAGARVSNNLLRAYLAQQVGGRPWSN